METRYSFEKSQNQYLANQIKALSLPETCWKVEGFKNEGELKHDDKIEQCNLEHVDIKINQSTCQSE